MAEKKSIIEEAILDMKNIQSALNANTKEILRSVAREEIDSVVKESLLKEVGYAEEDLDAPEGETELGGTADAATSDIEPVGGEESEEGGLGDIESSEVVPVNGPEDGMDSVELGTEPMDMTAASDDDVIAIYKKLSGEDEIEIVGDEIHLNISEPGEYVVKANDTDGGLGASSEVPADLAPIGGEESGEEGGVDYEIEMGDDEGGETPADLEPVDAEGDEEELDETIANVNGHAGAQGARRSGASHLGYGKSSMNGEKIEESTSNKLVSEVTTKYNNLLTEAKKLKSENEEFRKALKMFRNQLVETVVFNSNLTYTTRLFMEHSTTKSEKQNIIKRFDTEVSSLIESKKLYKTIVNELESRKPVTESVENKIIKEVTTGASKQLNESTAYVDPSTRRIIDLMNRVEKR